MEEPITLQEERRVEFKHDEPGEGELYACRFLEAAGYQLQFRDIIGFRHYEHPDPSHKRTPKEYRAMAYLCEEHEYAFMDETAG